MTTAYVALGSNIEPRMNYLQEAINQVDNHEKVHVLQSSPIYETAPVGYTEQDDFLNAVIKLETTLEPLDLLAHCQSIEQQLGRERSVKWGPRTIDLDILLYNDERVATDHLTLPHPRLHERAFVLVPLHDIDSELYIDRYHKQVRQLLADLPAAEKEGVRQWKPKNGENE
ncbi:2-amino-4-hydroxy-6-hydroxymethyldihydropteridine diphosphokinase [Pontibacillus salicampi]|uniref:2-amino-4-hydroxy-6-hydroxymethyldihydropteridine diphosphokinase n=1 Tax=Pontibacillus salicampi TaxID=1449801 RepID=A0ABV6LT81_9BACI